MEVNSMQYVYSKYNVVVDKTDNLVTVWNTKHGSLVEFEMEVFDLLSKNYFEDARIQKDFKAMIKEGFVVDKALDELEEILFQAKQKQYSTGQDMFALVIAPTLNCNYHCPYCFESLVKHDKGIMSEEVINAIVDTISNKIAQSNSLKKVKITWFGGEPLLTYDKVIVPLQKRLSDLCMENNKEFIVNMVTNGYYLTEEKFDFLFGKGEVKFVQITFDGTAEEYSERKGTTQEAYHRVRNNILNLSKYLIENKLETKINVRLNADKNNYENIKLFISRLKEEDNFHENIRFFLARLRDYISNPYSNSCFNTEDFEEIQGDFDAFVGNKADIPEPKVTFCGQHCMNIFCVGAKGELYKCEHDFGVQAHIVGDIRSGLYHNKYFNEFMEQPLPDKCRNCKILPVCMAGCPHRRLELHQEVECEHTIQGLIEKVKKYIKGG